MEKLADGRPEFGNPAPFNSSIPEILMASFTLTLRTQLCLDQMQAFTGNEAGHRWVIYVQDSNWAYVGCFCIISRTS